MTETDELIMRMIKRFCEAKRPRPTHPICINMGEDSFRKQVTENRCVCPALARDAVNDMLRTLPQPSEGLGK